MIRKDISRSRRVAKLSPDALALFAMLIPHYNAHGKMDGNPYSIKGTVVPFIDWLDIPTITHCLNEISEKTNVKYFQVDGCWYLHSLNYDEHQSLKRKGRDYLPSYSVQVPDQSGSSPGLIRPEVEVEVEVEPEVEVEVEERKTKARRAKKPSPAFELPPTIHPEVWASFEEHRNKLRKPMTDKARHLILLELQKLRGDPNALLEQSIRKGWQDVFPLKEGQNGSGPKGSHGSDRREGAIVAPPGKYAGIGTVVHTDPGAGGTGEPVPTAAASRRGGGTGPVS